MAAKKFDTGIRLKIVRKTDLLIFVLLVAVGATGLALVATYFFVPVESHDTAFKGTRTITPIVSVPIALWIGLKTMRINLLQAELERLVNRDRLTDVSTRDFFYARLADYPESYGVSLMVDIDHFKSVNDTYGHGVGDVVIASVAKALKDCVRPGDIVCRFGGEEFVIFLKDADVDDAKFIAERMRAHVEKLLIDTQNKSVAVTVSIGGSLAMAAAQIDSAINQADEALYVAKRSGRNQVVMTPQRPDKTSAAS